MVSTGVGKATLLTVALLVVLAGVLLGRGPAGAAPESARGTAPAGFLNVVPQSAVNADQATLLGEAGVRMLRVPLNWLDVEPNPPFYDRPDWSRFDNLMRVAAGNGLSVLPFVWGSPDWAAPRPEVEPAANSFARSSWRKFLRLAVQRYGPSGTFWRQNPALPERPIRVWQIWNEPNIVTFARPPSPMLYARLVRISAGALRSVDPGAKVLLAGGIPRRRLPDARGGGEL